MSACKRGVESHFRLSQSELESVKANASLLGCTVSDYVRGLCIIPVTFYSQELELGSGSVRVLVYNRKSFSDLRRQLRAWGYHYNQAMRALVVVNSKKFLNLEDTDFLFTNALGRLERIDKTREELLLAINSLSRFKFPMFSCNASSSSSAKRDVYLHVRLSSTELDTMKANASLLGCTVSDYVRGLCIISVTLYSPELKLGSGSVRSLVYDCTSFSELRQQFRAWGYHYNQAVHALNTICSKKFLSQEDTYLLFTNALALLENIDNAREGLLLEVDSLKGFPLVTFDRKAVSNGT